MPTDPRLLKLKIERLKQENSSGWDDILDVVEGADELARNLPPEKTCKDNTWKNLRASELLEELSVMVTLPGKAMAQPNPTTARWIFGCISALYHALRVMDISRDGPAEQILAMQCSTIVSAYVKWFGISSEDWPGLPESRRQMLLLVYRLCAPMHVEGNPPDKIDESFLGLIEFEELAQIIVPSIVVPIQLQGEPRMAKNVIWAGCHILSTYGKTKGFANTTAEDYVKKYGADHMAKCCAVIIETSPASVKLIVHASSLVQYLLFAPAFHRSIVRKWRIHLRLMKKWWEAERAASEKQVNVGFGHFLFFSDLGALLLGFTTAPLQRGIIADLVQEQDLILLLGFGPIRRLGLGGPPYLSQEIADPLYQGVVEYCRDDVFLMTRHITPMWFHVMDCLRSIKRCANPLWGKVQNKESSEVDLWQAFGAKLGISEESLRQEQAQARKKDFDSLIGCSFLRCPLYGEDICDRANPPLRCVECKSSQYCSTSCQKHDWRDGHKTLCRPHSPTPDSGG